jgi:hypothetical protein
MSRRCSRTLPRRRRACPVTAIGTAVRCVTGRCQSAMSAGESCIKWCFPRCALHAESVLVTSEASTSTEHRMTPNASPIAVHIPYAPTSAVPSPAACSYLLWLCRSEIVVLFFISVVHIASLVVFFTVAVTELVVVPKKSSTIKRRHACCRRRSCCTEWPRYQLYHLSAAHVRNTPHRGRSAPVDQRAANPFMRRFCGASGCPR